MKTTRLFRIALAAVGYFWGAGQGFAENPSVAALYLGQAGCPRASAMGEAFTAVAEDVNGVFWNPAGLVRSPNTELLISHVENIQAFRDEYFAFSLPVNSQDAWGFHGFFSYAGGFEKSTLENPDLGSFGVTNAYFGAVWSHAWDSQFSSGISLKGINQSIDTYSAWSAAADLSVFYRDAFNGLDLGLAVRNLGKPIQFIHESAPIPFMFEAGAGYRLMNREVLVTLDIRQPLYQELELKAGAEWRLEGIIAFRAGYQYSQSLNRTAPLAGLNAGLGLEISDYKLDYAFSPGSDLGAIHRMAVTFPFGKSLQEEERIVQRMEKKLREKQETMIRGYWQTAEVFFRKGDYPNAILYYQKILAINPSVIPSVSSRLAEADHRMKAQIANRHFKKASDAFKRKDYIMAIVEWTKVLEMAPNHREAEKWLRQANLRLSQEESSMIAGQKKASSQAGEIKSFIIQGLDALKRSDYLKAIDCWNSVLAREPGHEQVRNYLHRTKAKMQEEVEEGIELGNQAWREEDYPGAVKAWRQVLKIDPSNATARKMLTDHQDEIKAKSDEMYRKAVESYVKNRLGDAIVGWKSVLILEPDNAKAAKNLSRAQEKLKEIEAF